MFLVIMFWIYFLSCVMQLFSSGLWQRGKRDQDGILGFLPADIRREQKRGLRLVSTFLPLIIWILYSLQKGWGDFIPIRSVFKSNHLLLVLWQLNKSTLFPNCFYLSWPLLNGTSFGSIGSGCLSVHPVVIFWDKYRSVTIEKLDCWRLG